jgi:hypothetical protein
MNEQKGEKKRIAKSKSKKDKKERNMKTYNKIGRI